MAGKFDEILSKTVEKNAQKNISDWLKFLENKTEKYFQFKFLESGTEGIIKSVIKQNCNKSTSRNELSNENQKEKKGRWKGVVIIIIIKKKEKNRNSIWILYRKSKCLLHCWGSRCSFHSTAVPGDKSNQIKQVRRFCFAERQTGFSFLLFFYFFFFVFI